MNEPPVGISDAGVLAIAQAHWDPAVDRVEHLPVGFGAWHWRASVAGTARLFVTYDLPKPGRHTAETLESAYAGAAALRDAGLEFVVPPIRTSDGRFTVPAGAGLLSATPWVVGERPAVADGVRPLLERLHAMTPPARIAPWWPPVGPQFSDELAERIFVPWNHGPFGERAREAIRTALPEITRWTQTYHRLGAAEDPDTWVTTHGEPHEHNQPAASSTWSGASTRSISTPRGSPDPMATEDDREAIAGLEAEVSRE